MSLPLVPSLSSLGGSLSGPGGAATVGLAALFVALTAVETLRPLVRRPVESRGRLLTNFGLGLLSFGLGALLPLSVPGAALLAGRNGWGLLNLANLPAWLEASVTVLAVSLAHYLFHRAAHAWPLLWRVHRVHHADTAVDLSTTLRNHPLELLVVAPWLCVVALALGLSAPVLAAYQVVALGFGLWGHANLRLPEPVDRALRLVLVTPPMHHVHHSTDARETDSNFGDILSLWDRLFGTYTARPLVGLGAMRRGLGAAEDAMAGHFARQLARPFRPAEPSTARAIASGE